jgi:hypothetical protein
VQDCTKAGVYCGAAILAADAFLRVLLGRFPQAQGPESLLKKQAAGWKARPTFQSQRLFNF